MYLLNYNYKFGFIALSFRCVVGTGVLDGPLPQCVFADRPGGRSLQGLCDKPEFIFDRRVVPGFGIPPVGGQTNG